jgi:PIN domain nuclease of toxin-antitoxin system
MSAYVTDTHPLLWYAAGERSKPSQKVLQIFEAAESEQALVYVPAVVVWETTLVARGGFWSPHRPFDQWMKTLFSGRGFDLAPLTIETISESRALSSLVDPFDMMIVATARILDLPLITVDERITDSRLVDVIW